MTGASRKIWILIYPHPSDARASQKDTPFLFFLFRRQRVSKGNFIFNRENIVRIRSAFFSRTERPPALAPIQPHFACGENGRGAERAPAGMGVFRMRFTACCAPGGPAVQRRFPPARARGPGRKPPAPSGRRCFPAACRAWPRRWRNPRSRTCRHSPPCAPLQTAFSGPPCLFSAASRRASICRRPARPRRPAPECRF